jgi:hypothetical protein
MFLEHYEFVIFNFLIQVYTKITVNNKMLLITYKLLY